MFIPDSRVLKSSQNKKDLNDVTAALFSVFFAAGSWEKDTENGAAVTSLKSFLFRDDFNTNRNLYIVFANFLGKYILTNLFVNIWDWFLRTYLTWKTDSFIFIIKKNGDWLLFISKNTRFQVWVLSKYHFKFKKRVDNTKFISDPKKE